MAVVNRTGGLINLTMLGKNLTTNAIDIYQMLITTGEPVSFSCDPLSSGNYAYQGVRDKSGAIIGQVQLDEEDPSGEISFSFYEDFDYVGDDFLARNSKNKLLNLLNGESFKNGEDIIVPIGTNGTDKVKTARAKYSEMNKPCKMVYYNEGEFIKENGTADTVTGLVALKKNPYASSFNMSHKTFCMEFQTTSGQGQVTRMFPILAKSTAEWAEGDINQFNLTAQRGCDMVERTNFFTEVIPEPEPKGEGKVDELYVDFFVKEGATEPQEEELQDSELLALLKNDGTVEIKKFNAFWSQDHAIQNKLKVGTRIKTNVRIESGKTQIKGTAFAIMGMDGEHVVDFSTDGSGRHFCTVQDYDKTVGKFVALNVE